MLRCGLVEIERRFRGSYCLHHQHDLAATAAADDDDVG
jgi:hypothetical protein